jgi:tetratricopeptide (TPR) repeat protein
MTLRASLMRQLNNPQHSLSQRAELRCQLANELEEKGDYEGAREVMGELWQRVGERPQVHELDQSTAAEVLLRAGVLTGWLGSVNQIQGAQETAKNLISESLHVFESRGSSKKVLEAQTELAYCYWREGAYDEARVMLKGVVAGLTTDSKLKAKAMLRSAIVERSANRYKDALRILTDTAPLFDKIHNHTIKGGYHNELGLVLKNLAASENREDYLDRAFVEYTAASYHFEQAEHKYYRAHVENNLGFLYFKADKFEEAHEHLELARHLLVSLKDRGYVAQVDETRARVFLAEGRNAEAEQTAGAAVNVLGKGGRQSLLAEALITHGIALARLKHYDFAHSTFLRAMEVAHQSGALNDAGLAALTMLEELGAKLDIDEMQTVYERAYCWLTPSQHLPTLHRLLHAASRVLSAGRKKKPATAAEVEIINSVGKVALDEMMQRFENNIIRQALTASQGSITRAALLLGISHQRLGYILESRQRDLQAVRTPMRTRQSVIKKVQS